MAAIGQKMANRVWKGVYPFFYSCTPFMRKVDNGKNGGERGKMIQMEIVVSNVITSRPPEWQLIATIITHAPVF